VSSSSFSPDEIRAAAETHRELGPDYQDAVIESFLDKVGKEIDARVDARLGRSRGGWQPEQPAQPAPIAQVKQYQPMTLAIVSMVLGIPLTAITVTAGSHPAGIAGLLVVWAAIAAINIAYAVRLRPPPGR
jgi:hypothetical protein